MEDAENAAVDKAAVENGEETETMVNF